MSEYLINASTLTGIASAIRSKTGSTSAFTPAQIISAINDIPAGIPYVPPHAYQSSNIVSYVGNEQYILDYAFADSSLLTTVSLPNCSYIERYAFQSCTSLLSLYLNEVSSVPTLVDTDVFKGSPLSALGSGNIYVSRDLYPNFRYASNWSTLSSRFVSM